MVQSMNVTCLSCGYSWISRKDATRYQRQCPRCKHTDLDENKGTSSTQEASSTTTATIGQPTTIGSRWPKVVYDLMGAMNATSPENALQRAFEFYRQLLQYKYKYNLKSPEEAFEFLEKKAADGNKRVAEVEAKLQDVIRNLESILLEAGGDIAAIRWYDASVREGYGKDFLTFLNETIGKYFEQQGYELELQKSEM